MLPVELKGKEEDDASEMLLLLLLLPTAAVRENCAACLRGEDIGEESAVLLPLPFDRLAFAAAAAAATEEE